MKRLAFLLLVTACASRPPAASTPAAPSAPPNPLITHPIEVGRLDDLGGNHMLATGEPRIKVDGNVVSVWSCRPDGEDPGFVADDQHHAYVTFTKSELQMPKEGPPQMKPAEYCSFERYVMPDGITFVGELPK